MMLDKREAIKSKRSLTSPSKRVAREIKEEQGREEEEDKVHKAKRSIIRAC